MSRDPYFDNDANARTSKNIHALAGMFLFGASGFCYGVANHEIWIGFVGLGIGLVLALLISWHYGGRGGR